MIVGALLQATAYSRAHMIVARIVSGVGMGFINSTVPVFQAEFSPKASRGLCKNVPSLFIESREGGPDENRCLHATLDPQLWHLPRLLDRLRLHAIPHSLLHVARSMYPTMHLPPPHAASPAHRPRDTEMASFPRSSLPISLRLNPPP
jgi:hypothetical protein